DHAVSGARRTVRYPVVISLSPGARANAGLPKVAQGHHRSKTDTNPNPVCCTRSCSLGIKTPSRRVCLMVILHRHTRRDVPRAHQHAPRRPQRPSGPALRGFGSREGGTNRVFGGGCRPRRATDESASEAGWSERVRAATGPREREDERGAASRARGSGRTSAERTPRARVERARPRSQGPREREDERGTPACGVSGPSPPRP
ncbi:MAG: hypothetical protein RLZZ246_759, partial [Planctomycetota bacterium]